MPQQSHVLNTMIGIVLPIIDHMKHVIGKHQPFPGHGFSVRHNLIVGDGGGPGVKIGAKLETIGLSAEDEIGLLQHFHRLITVGHAAKNEAI